MAALKVRVSRGKPGICGVYAPHNGHPYSLRQRFFSELTEFARTFSTHGAKVILGDLNARLYRQVSGEGRFVGPYVFSNASANIPSDANRHLMLELCSSLDMAVANTFFAAPTQQLATCYNVGQQRTNITDWVTHSQIDYLLCEVGWLHVVEALCVDRYAALASHHFLLEASLKSSVPISKKPRDTRTPSLLALEDPIVSNRFAALVADFMQDLDDNSGTTVNLDQQNARMADAFTQAANSCLPQRDRQTSRPWISETTLGLIRRRQVARSHGDSVQERLLNKEVRRSVSSDKGAWLDTLLASRDWSQIRRLRKGFVPKQGRLRDIRGAEVDSDRRAETLAEHLETVQWAVRPTTLLENKPAIREELPMDLGDVHEKEVMAAAQGLKAGRASGLDGLPAEFWKSIL